MSEPFQLQNDTRILALSFWQPWASLVAMGLKRFETRSWRMSYRGPLAIHATKSSSAEIFDWLLLRPQRQLLDRILVALDRRGVQGMGDLPLGAVLCVTRAIRTVPVESIRDRLDPFERAFGNYGDGRWAIELEVTELYDSPIPARGKQGLWSFQPPIPNP